MIEYNAILEVVDDEGAIQLLLNNKYTVILVDPGSPIRNNPHSTILFLGETNTRDYQYKTEAATHHYL